MSHDSRKLASPRLLADGRVCCSHKGALCPKCEAHHAARNPQPPTVRSAESYAPPDPYAADIAKLRSAR